MQIRKQSVSAILLSGMCTVAMLLAPTAAANESITSEPSATGDWGEEHRLRTIVHYGATTAADIAACKEEWKERPFTKEYRGYDFPCPTFEITEADVAQARAELERLHTPPQGNQLSAGNQHSAPVTFLHRVFAMLRNALRAFSGHGFSS